MLRNYLKIALRHILKYKSHAFINVLGLAIGLACCTLLLLYVQDELTFDGFHNKADRIYRVNESRRTADGDDRYRGYTAGAVGPALQRDLPEVEDAVRLFMGWRLTIKREGTGLIVRDYFFSDSSFFRVFDFPVLQGNPANALAAPRSIVLSASMAHSLFGDEPAVGRTLKVEAEDFPEFGVEPFTVTAVVADPPHNSHLDFKLLISMNTLDPFTDFSRYLSSWDAAFLLTYITLDAQNELEATSTKLPDLSNTYRGPEAWQQRKLVLQPLRDIHFHSAHIEAEHNKREGDLIYVYIFAAIALLIVLIAAINYLNIATARSLGRAREVGLRKVVGAGRRQLVGQFLGESLLTVLIALAVAIGLVELLLPFFNTLAQKNLQFALSANTELLLAMLLLALIVGLLAGSFPAFHLSRFRPIAVMHGMLPGGRRAGSLRRALVVTQFSLSIAMIAATLVVARQLDFVHSKTLGFNKEWLVVIDINHDDVQSKYISMRTELKRHAGIEQVTTSSRVPGDWKSFRQIDVQRDGVPEGEGQRMYFNGVDEYFLSTYEIDLVAGRNFQRELASDSAAVLLNETAAKALFDESPLGRMIQIPNFEFRGRVVGVVRDFHFHSLHAAIAPMVIGFMPESGRHPVHGIDYFSVRLAGANIPEALDYITEVHGRFDPVNPTELAFLRDWWGELYDRDARIGQVFGAAAALAIFIACLGLFGLASFAAQQRSKEIGIRKVLGASVRNIVLLLARDFTRLVLIGFVLAIPLAWFAMQQWLQDFAYRIDIGGGLFLTAGLLALAIAGITVSYQAIKAALANPVDAIKYE